MIIYSVEHMKNKREINGVEAVNKALEILNCFTERDETLSVTKISNITGNYKSRISWNSTFIVSCYIWNFSHT